jgi:hypothetical protein
MMALAAALGALFVVQTGCSPAEAQLEPLSGDRRTISVSGSGTVSARPDQAVVRLGVETMAETAEQALSSNSEQMQAVIAALEETGVPTDTIQTQTVQLRPRYETPEPPEGREPEAPGRAPGRELVGYVASNVVEATTEDLDMVGDLLDTAVQAGANRVEGISFRLENATELLEQAREAAWENAEQKAGQLAELSGVTLDEVVSINESTRGPRPVYLGGAVEREEAAVPIEPGTEDVQVDLQVTWSIQ